MSRLSAVGIPALPAQAVAEGQGRGGCQSLAMHIGYRLDYFCTMDEGKGTRGRSILDA